MPHMVNGAWSCSSTGDPSVQLFSEGRAKWYVQKQISGLRQTDVVDLGTSIRY